MAGFPTTSRTRVPRELEVALNGPIGPQRVRDDTEIIDADGWYRLLTPSAHSGAANEVFFSNLQGGDIDGQIDAVIGEYHDRGLPMTWCVYPWTHPGDLGERLSARGATSLEVRAYVVDTALPLEQVDGVEVERVDPSSAAAFNAYFDILGAGYAMSAGEAAFRRRRYRELCSGANPQMHLYVARCNGEYAGCTAMVMKGDSAHLTTVSIKPEFQGRGIMQSMTAAQLADLRAQGIALADGHANAQSSFWVERFGFRFVYPYTIYELAPPKASA